MKLLQEYIDVCHDGNQAKAAAALGVTRFTINKILAGTRSVTPRVAELIEADSEGRFRKESFIWPESNAA